MALNKSDLFEDNDIKLAERMKALGHPARVAIIKLLAQQKACICGDITNALPLAQATVSQHLKALKNAGLIKGEIEGVRTCYCLNEAAVGELIHDFNGLSDLLESNKIPNKCC
ncbi:MAG TPA: metalloregulator ArsR/SmtB family transcription factor [Balneolales bacterium]|nr:metalloregulator ArsR/SmtB family transcription factor [Balneolales bacterium]